MDCEELTLPERRPGDPGSEPCRTALAGIGAYLAAEIEDDRIPALRGHLAVCATCNEEFRRGVLVAARFGREQRLAREEREREERRLRHRRMALEAHAGSGSRHWRLRLLLIPTAAILMLGGVTRILAPDEGRAHCLEGTVRVAGELLERGGGPRRVGRGDACETGAEARARLDLGATSVILEPRSALLVERAGRHAVRVRLERGALEARGPAVVTTAAGLVDLDLGGRVAIDAEGLMAEGSSGQPVTLIDASGTRRAVGGERLRGGPLARAGPE